jgi:hypothetical protein
VCDLLGIFNLDGPQPPLLPSERLPTLRWGRDDLPVRSVTGRGLAARFVEHLSGNASYHTADGLHLFVVGEARLRSDAALPVPGLQAENCPLLSAGALLALRRAHAQRFIHQLKGNFTLVLVDERLRETTLYNSRFGISPFYYALDGARFIFSTSLAAAAACLSRRPEIDPAAVAELALFNYPLSDRTYCKDIHMLCPAEVVRVDRGGVRRETYWDVWTLYDVPLLPKREAWETGATLFHRTVNDLAAEQARVRVSFTSGFDSRAVLSVLEKEPADVLGYSFGIPGSLNVEIPRRIAQEMGLPFAPIALDSAYEQVFGDYALRALMLSDCLSTAERANYPYAFERLADFSPVVITGLFGSELMRTFQNVGHIVSANLVRLNLAGDPSAELGRIMAAPGAVGYFATEVLSQTIREVETDVAGVFERFGDLPCDRRFYMLLLTEGLRKYFGAEVHMERPWGVNRFPFLDDEFVEFAFRAPFAGVHSRTIRPTIGNRFHSQYFYAYVISKYRPDLLRAPTDHGHSPKDLLSPFALLRIGPKYLFWRWKRQWVRYREFKTEEWTEAFYRQRLITDGKRGDLFSRRFVEDFGSGAWRTTRLEFAKAASLKLWLAGAGIG